MKMINAEISPEAIMNEYKEPNTDNILSVPSNPSRSISKDPNKIIKNPQKTRACKMPAKRNRKMRSCRKPFFNSRLMRSLMGGIGYGFFNNLMMRNTREKLYANSPNDKTVTTIKISCSIGRSRFKPKNLPKIRK